MPSWKKVIISGSNAALNSLNVTTTFTASGLNYPTTDNGEESFLQTNGSGNLSFQYVKTIYEEVYNGEATTITKGTPLYVSGSVGAAAQVFRADASNALKMPVIYVSADNIASGATGRGIALGLITGVDTTGYPAGSEIYVAAGGGWTSTRPTGTNIVQLLGIVTKEGAGGQGIVLNPGPFENPNLTPGNVWVGNGNSLPVPVATSSLSVASASFAVSSSRAVSSSYTEAAKTVGITTQDTTPVTYNVVFTGGTSGNQSLNVDQTTLTYNPSTTTLAVTNLAGTATTASNITPAITNAGDNRVLTSNGGGTVNGEANLTFNGSLLTATGNGENIRINSSDTNGSYMAWSNNTTAKGYIGSAYHLFGAPYNLADDFGIRANNSLAISTGGTPVRMFISSSGNIGVATSTPVYPLHVSASVSNVSIYASNDIVAFSDQSVKENIRPIENVLERIGDSRGVLYDRVDNGEKDNIGFIAQELEVAFPELVVTNPDGTKAVKYQNAVAVLFEAVKEQQKQINKILTLLNK
jgi:hypothetical protein